MDPEVPITEINGMTHRLGKGKLVLTLKRDRP